MIENKSSEVIPTDVWNSVVERVSENKETQWKGKGFRNKIFVNFRICEDMNQTARVKHVLSLIGKFFGLLSLLYIFVCSLDIMSSAFRLVGGKKKHFLNLIKSSVLKN